MFLGSQLRKLGGFKLAVNIVEVLIGRHLVTRCSVGKVALLEPNLMAVVQLLLRCCAILWKCGKLPPPSSMHDMT